VNDAMLPGDSFMAGTLYRRRTDEKVGWLEQKEFGLHLMDLFFQAIWECSGGVFSRSRTVMDRYVD
jgi:hypothetical protein